MNDDERNEQTRGKQRKLIDNNLVLAKS